MAGENPASPRPYLEIFAAIIRDKRISHGAFRLWHCLRDYTNADSKCFPGQRRLAHDIGCRPHSLKCWTNELSAAGWLLFEPPKLGCGICYTVLDGNGQPLRKSASPTVAENSISDRCAKAQQGVAENSNDPLRKSATKVSSPFNQERGKEKTPPVSATPKPVIKKREMWQLIADRKKTEDAINKEKEKASPDAQILSALRTELRRTNDELRLLGSSAQAGEDATKPRNPNDRNAGTYNANTSADGLKTLVRGEGWTPPVQAELPPAPVETTKQTAQPFEPSPELAAKFRREAQEAINAVAICAITNIATDWV